MFLTMEERFEMKFIVLLIPFFLTSCYALSNPGAATQPVKLLDGKQNIYKTSCSGMVETWPDCLSKAKSTCPNGYDELYRDITPVGARRELKFKCK